VVAKRRKHFTNIQLSGDLATAKVDMLSKVTSGTFGIVLVEGHLMIGKGGLSLYEN